MGMLVLLVVQMALYAALYWALRAFWPVLDNPSYRGGVFHMAGIVVIGLLLPQLYFALRRRRWTADPRLWWNRVAARVTSDWEDHRAGWDVDLIRVAVVRRRDHGTLTLVVALIGWHLHVQVLLDPAEAAAFQEGQRRAREAYIRAMPSVVQAAMRDMLKDVPLEAQIEVGAVPVLRRDGEDDDNGENGGGESGGGNKGIH